MRNRNEPLRLGAAAVGLAMLASLAAPLLLGRACARAHAHVLSLLPATLSAVDCEGEACGQVTVTFDETKQQYKVQNNSADRWVRVSASNLAASASACVPPGRPEYLALKNIEGSYRAAYAEPGCDMHSGRGPMR
jgi:hypothetical protein